MIRWRYAGVGSGAVRHGSGRKAGMAKMWSGGPRYGLVRWLLGPPWFALAGTRYVEPWCGGRSVQGFALDTAAF